MDKITSRKPLVEEKIMTPVTLFGVVVPCQDKLVDRKKSDFKLVCASGLEYFIVADLGWRDILSRYCWEDVKVTGLLDVCAMAVVPQKIVPKGPAGERNNVIDFAVWKGRSIARKLRTVSDLILVPAAVLAVMMF